MHKELETADTEYKQALLSLNKDAAIPVQVQSESKAVAPLADLLEGKVDL